MAKIKIEKELYERLTKFSSSRGYSSVDEFITHMLEKQVELLESSETDPDILERLQGLGYIE